MARRSRSPWWVLLIVLLVGALLGGVIAEAVGQYPALTILSRSISAGLDPPLSLDLRLITLTLGFTVRLNLATLLGIIIGVWIFRLL